MSTSATSGFALSLPVAARRRANPASSSARSAAGTSIPGGGTGLLTGWAYSEAAANRAQNRRFILPDIILRALHRDTATELGIESCHDASTGISVGLPDRVRPERGVVRSFGGTRPCRPV